MFVVKLGHPEENMEDRNHQYREQQKYFSFTTSSQALFPTSHFWLTFWVSSAESLAGNLATSWARLPFTKCCTQRISLLPHRGPALGHTQIDPGGQRG